MQKMLKKNYSQAGNIKKCTVSREIQANKTK